MVNSFQGHVERLELSYFLRLPWAVLSSSTSPMQGSLWSRFCFLPLSLTNALTTSPFFQTPALEEAALTGSFYEQGKWDSTNFLGSDRTITCFSVYKSKEYSRKFRVCPCLWVLLDTKPHVSRMCGSQTRNLGLQNGKSLSNFPVPWMAIWLVQTGLFLHTAFLSLAL